MTGHFRFLVRLMLMIVALLVALALHGAWRLVRRRSPWPRWLLGRIARIAGARAAVTGAPLARDVVFVSNHLSWLDILLIAGATGSAFVGKAELGAVPLIGWLCTLNGTIFVARGDRMAVGAQVASVRAALADGWAVTLFPEGTTGDGVALLPFKAALFAALDPPPPGVQVQPVRIDYGAATRELAWVGAEPGASHASRVLRRRGTFVARLAFLSPFDPAALPGRKAVAAEAQRRIAAAMMERP